MTDPTEYPPDPALAALIAHCERDPIARLAGPGMVVLSLLSDAQEVLERDNVAMASAMIDRAKALLIHYRLGLPVPVNLRTAPALDPAHDPLQDDLPSESATEALLAVAEAAARAHPQKLLDAVASHAGYSKEWSTRMLALEAVTPLFEGEIGAGASDVARQRAAKRASDALIDAIGLHADAIAARYFDNPDVAHLASIYAVDLVVTLRKEGLL
jgi:hypothetical protein